MDPRFSGGATLSGPFTLGPDATIRGPADEAAPILAPRRALEGAYTAAEVLGAGGTGVVRRAVQHALDREVAIKTPHGAHSPGAVTRVLQEAWVTGALEHPGVVPVHDLVVDEAGVPHIVMRRLQGWTWTELLNQPDEVVARFGVRDVLEWHLRVLMSVAATVHHAHGRGILHRDLKPDNVMIGPSGDVCVLDWGIAVALDERADRRLPRAADQCRLAGTPHFMAPELARADGAAQGVATDVYLLGGCLYALLTLRPPHAGTDVPAVIRAAAETVPPPPEGPARLVALCVEALSADPAARPPSAEAFRRRVQAWLEERDADALVAAGAADLAGLRAAVVDPASAEVATLHARCRVAFEQARLRRPGHPDADAGLAEAHTLRLGWELARNDARAAAATLALMEAPPAALAESVRRAVAREATQDAQARQLLADHDEAVGIRTRAFVSLIIGSVITLVPLATHFLDRDAPLVNVAVGTALAGALMVGMGVWARDSLSRSVLNRAVIRGLVATPSVHLILMAGAWGLGLDVATMVVFFPLHAGIITTIFAIILDPWMFVPAAGYFAAFLLAAAHPPLRWVALSAGNAVLLATALVRWGPDAFESWMRLRRERRKPGPPPG